MPVGTPVSQEQQNPNVAIGDFKQHLYSQLKAAGVMSSLKVCDFEVHMSIDHSKTACCTKVEYHAADSAAVSGPFKAPEAAMQRSRSNTDQRHSVAQRHEQPHSGLPYSVSISLYPFCFSTRGWSEQPAYA